MEAKTAGDTDKSLENTTKHELKDMLITDV